MADLNNMRADINRLRNELEKRLIVTSEKMALNFKAFATTKLVNSGIPGAKYSENALPLFFLTGNAKTKYGEEAIKKLDKKRRKDGQPGVSYKDLREVENLPTDMVNLTFTGEMLRAWGIVQTSQEGDKFLTYLGGTNKASADKLGWNRERFGDFFAKVVGEEGIEFLRNILGNDMDDFFESNKLNQ